MKKTLLFGIIVLISITSCKKEYTCECKKTVTVVGIPYTSIYTTKANSRKKDAQAWCDGLKSTTVTNGTSSTNAYDSCELK